MVYDSHVWSSNSRCHRCGCSKDAGYDNPDMPCDSFMYLAELPPDHHLFFSGNWWNARRRRDYYIDQDGCVKRKNDSETAKVLAVKLVSDAWLAAVPPAGTA